jgi:two-component system sensor histidine kinase/response regulator
LGIVDYLSKPVWESDLVKRIAKALETGWNGNAPAAHSGSKEKPASILRVLLAESNEVTQVLVTHLLEKRGHQVFAAEDMRQVVSALEDGRDIDIVLMDTEISDANGLEAARAIREIDRKSGRRTPIIAMTGNPTKGEEEACVAAEIDDYLAKPVRPAALFESIRRVIALPSAAATAKVLPSVVFDRPGFLRRLEGDEALGREIIEMFLQEYPKLLQNLHRAAEQRDPSALQRAAHALKGSVGDMAAPQAFDAARDLEKKARDGDLKEVDAALMSLEEAVQSLVRELRNADKRAA